MNLLKNVTDIRLEHGQHIDQYKLTFYYELGELECKLFAEVDVKEDNMYHSDVNDTEYGYDVNIKNVQVDDKATFIGHSGQCTLLLTDKMRAQVADLAIQKINQCEIEILTNI